MRNKTFLLAFSKMNPQVSVFRVIVNCKAPSGQAAIAIPDSIHYNGVCASSPTDKTNTFSQFFTECFNHADASNTPIPQYNFSSTLSCFPALAVMFFLSSKSLLFFFSSKSLPTVLLLLGLTGKLLKNTATSICPILCRLFNLSLITSRVPDAWKVSRVTRCYSHL